MPNFYYKLLTQTSKIQEGEINAFSKSNALKELKKDGSVVIFISNRNPAFLEKIINYLKSDFKSTEKINFYNNIFTMLEAGVSIIEALETVSNQTKSKRLRNVILEIANGVKNGQKISATMAKFPKFFPANLIETINAGDVSGNLAQTFNRISLDLQKNDEVRKKIQGALTYPIIVICLMIITATIMILYLLPAIKKIYDNFGANLPITTKIMLSVGSFVSDNRFIILGVLIATVIASFFIIKIKRVKYWIHYIVIKIPILGSLLRDYNLLIFFRSFKSLFESGTSILSSISISKKTTQNEVFKKAISELEPLLLHGVSFSDAIMRHPYIFPGQIQKIIKIGEKTGKMDDILNHIVNYYERSVDYKTRIMIATIEPMLMILTGLVVGGLAISIIAPIYSLIKII